MITFTYELTRSTARKCAIAGGNEMVSSNDRLNPHVKADLCAHLRKLSKELGIETLSKMEFKQFTKENPCYIGVIVHPPTKRRMDAINWYPTVKPIIDGLTDAGVFEDDNDKIITSMTFVPGMVTDNKKYRFEIIIREGVDEKWRT